MLKRCPIDSKKIKFLSQIEAQKIDIELMKVPGFSIDQLMELAGLSCAQSIYDVFPPQKDEKKVLVIAGPGNNGGDGLVAARHLKHFGYSVEVLYPIKTTKTNPQLFSNLVSQLEDMEIPQLGNLPTRIELENNYYIILDAIFGFSFKGLPRPPFSDILKNIIGLEKVKIVSIDIPSGWDVEGGDINKSYFLPHMLISLTAPKLCAQSFKGIHYLGGRFIPPSLQIKYGLENITYFGSNQFVELD